AFLFEHDLFRKPVPTFRDHALVPELLAQDTFVQAVARIEQHLDGDALVHADVDSAHRAYLVVIGYGGDGTFVWFEHFDGHAGSLRQQCTVPAARAKGTDRGEREERRVDRNDRSLHGQVIGCGAGGRRHHDAVGDELLQALHAVDANAQARG